MVYLTGDPHHWLICDVCNSDLAAQSRTVLGILSYLKSGDYLVKPFYDLERLVRNSNQHFSSIITAGITNAERENLGTNIDSSELFEFSHVKTVE